MFGGVVWDGGRDAVGEAIGVVLAGVLVGEGGFGLEG